MIRERRILGKSLRWGTEAENDARARRSGRVASGGRARRSPLPRRQIRAASSACGACVPLAPTYERSRVRGQRVGAFFWCGKGTPVHWSLKSLGRVAHPMHTRLAQQ